MNSIKVPIKSTEQVKRRLISANLYDGSHRLLKKGGFMHLPVLGKEKAKKLFPKAEFSNINLPKLKERLDLKETLSKKMTKAELENLKTAYDRLGDIAIIEVGELLEKRQKLIAETLLRLNPGIKTVYRKAAPHAGEFRLQQLAWLAGEKKSEATYKENGIVLKLDVTKVYFSPRLSNERKRIAGKVKKGEKVAVLFSGCGPYVCAIAKNTAAKEVLGIEINPVAHKYAIENAMLNKLSNVRLIKGDVRKVVPSIKEKFNRILMPLPKTGEDFLSTALKLAKKGTIVHFYDFQKEGEFNKAVEKIKKACKCKILEIVRCGQYSPYVSRICVDFCLTE